MNCQQCNKEFEAKRKTAKYCSNACRIAHLRAKDSVTPVTVTAESVTVKDSVTSLCPKGGTGICHGCGRRIMDIKNEWVGVPDERIALKMCLCLDCLNKGVTHESLGLNIADCEKKNANPVNPATLGQN